MKVIQRLLQSQVGVTKDVPHITSRAVLGAGFDLLNTLLTIAFPTACDLKGFSKNQETNRTLSLDDLRRLLYKLALKSSHFKGDQQILVTPPSHDTTKVHKETNHIICYQVFV